MENNYMDKIVRDALTNYDASLPPSDWSEMESRLDKSDAVRRKLYITKGVEALLMALTIWTVVQWVQADNYTNNFTNTETDVPAQMQPNTQPNAVIPAQVEKDDAPIQEKEDYTSTPLFDAAPFAYQQKANLTKQLATKEDKTIHFNHQNDMPIEHTLHSNEKSIKSNNTAENPAIFANNQLINLTIASLTPQLLDVENNLQRDLLQPFKTEKNSKREKSSRFRVSAFASVDWFSIKTPETVAVAKKARMLNPGAGITIDMLLKNDKSSKWRVESGVLMSQRNQVERSFSPLSNSQIMGEKVELSSTTVEVPLNLKYELGGLGDLQVYAMAGLSNHFVMDVRNTLLEKNLFYGVSYDPNFQPSTRDMSVENGLLDQGGELNDNHFLSLNTGVGAEYKINKKWSAFAQATYKQGMLTAGRHNDQISSFSVAAGMRSVL